MNMSWIEVILYYLFILTAIYMIVFFIQWLIGLLFSMNELEKYNQNSVAMDMIIDENEIDTPTIGVIIPSFNEASCINETIQALLDESYRKIDIIVVNDGSKDRTLSTILNCYDLKRMDIPYEQVIATKRVKDIYQACIGQKRIILLDKENGGKADALNCGLNFCNHDYCVIVDADTKIKRGALKKLLSKFYIDSSVIVCAGVVGSDYYGSANYKKLKIMQRLLIIFQYLEYFRTFYLQRILFNKLNANIIVSGAFAMFDCMLLKNIGGFRVNTIGEDMEMTLRLHAYCQSQYRDYHIAYIPEAKCVTQLPFTYHDYYQQRRRWHIGMMQSLKQHLYMLGNRHYGMAGILSSLFIISYELLAPLVEIIGIICLVIAYCLGKLNLQLTLYITLVTMLLVISTQFILLHGLCAYHVEKLDHKFIMKVIVVSFMEFFFFHPYNIVIKFIAFFTQKRNKQTWKHITREMDEI